MATGPRNRAVELMTHYITLLMKQSGLKPNSDTDAELTELIDAIIDAAVDMMPSRDQRDSETRDLLEGLGLHR